MGWIFRNAYQFFDQYQDMWDDLNRAQGNHILLDSMFVGPLIRCFAPEETLLGISTDPKHPGVALVVKTRRGCWQTFQPSQAPLGLIILGNHHNALCQIEALTHNLPEYAIKFSILQQDPDFTVFKNMKPQENVEILDYVNVARVTVYGTFEDYWKRRGTSFINDIKKKQRKIINDGIQYRFIISRNPMNVSECIREYARLEETGWKARQGTAVSMENKQGSFYQEILEKFCRQGEGIVYQLLFNGKIVASQLGLERGRMLILLKVAYDEDFKSYAPGFLIQREIFENLFTIGRVKEIEFYGRVLDGWTTKWTDEIRTMYHINFYRSKWVVKARRIFKTAASLLPSEGGQ